MERWITRAMALMCAAGCAGLWWTAAVFATLLWRGGAAMESGRATSSALQVSGVALLFGVLTAWGALHLFALADRANRPRTYACTRVLLIVLWLAAASGGVWWMLGRLAP